MTPARMSLVGKTYLRPVLALFLSPDALCSFVFDFCVCAPLCSKGCEGDTDGHLQHTEGPPQEQAVHRQDHGEERQLVICDSPVRRHPIPCDEIRRRWNQSQDLGIIAWKFAVVVSVTVTVRAAQQEEWSDACTHTYSYPRFACALPTTRGGATCHRVVPPFVPSVRTSVDDRSSCRVFLARPNERTS